MLDLDNAIKDIESAAADVTDEQINNFIDAVKNVIATVSDINKSELNAKLETAIKNISKSINRDIDVLHEYQAKLNILKKDKSSNEEQMKKEYSTANAKGSLSGIIDTIKSRISSIRKKIISLGKKAFNLITNIENKKKLKRGLSNVMFYVDKDISKQTIIDSLNEIQDLYNDTNKLRTIFSKVTKKAQDKAASLFGSTLKSTKEEYPEVYNLYKNINSKLRRFKRKDGPLVYGSNKRSYADILAEQYQKEKDEYEQGQNKHENFQNFKTYKEWLKGRKTYDQGRKESDEDIAEQERIHEENLKYKEQLREEQQNQEEETNTDEAVDIEVNINDFEYGFVDFDPIVDDEIESTKTNDELIAEAEEKVEKGYNGINEKNKKIQKGEDC